MAISSINLESMAAINLASYSANFVKIKRKSDGAVKSMVLNRARVFQETLATEQIPKRGVVRLTALKRRQAGCAARCVAAWYFCEVSMS